MPQGIRGYWFIAALALLLACLAIVFFTNVKRRTAHEQCALNLKLLGMTIAGASPDPKVQQGWDAVPNGVGFWLNHDRWPVLSPVRPVNARQQMVLCPVVAPVKRRTGCDYRGPARSVRLLQPEEPLGADKIGNHGPGRGGYVLTKNGEVFDCKETDPLWVKAAETTSE